MVLLFSSSSSSTLWEECENSYFDVSSLIILRDEHNIISFSEFQAY